MKKTAAHFTSTTTESREEISIEKLHVIREFVDTTWRIAVPVIIFVGIGIKADLEMGSKPWLTLVGVVFGFVVAGFLVKRQIDETSER